MLFVGKQLHQGDTHQTSSSQEHAHIHSNTPLTSSAAIRNKDSEKLISTFFFSKIFMIISCVRPGFSFSACVYFNIAFGSAEMRNLWPHYSKEFQHVSSTEQNLEHVKLQQSVNCIQVCFSYLYESSPQGLCCRQIHSLQLQWQTKILSKHVPIAIESLEICKVIREKNNFPARVSVKIYTHYKFI